MTLLFVDPRFRCHYHSQGGLNQPDKETHYEVAEGEVDGPQQQGWETYTV